MRLWYQQSETRLWRSLGRTLPQFMTGIYFVWRSKGWSRQNNRLGRVHARLLQMMDTLQRIFSMSYHAGMSLIQLRLLGSKTELSVDKNVSMVWQRTTKSCRKPSGTTKVTTPRRSTQGTNHVLKPSVLLFSMNWTLESQDSSILTRRNSNRPNVNSEAQRIVSQEQK